MTVEYRADIDGHRAIAVILVILYHAKLPFFQGGYIGVDVFFVISGYLITGILLNDASRHQLSIFAFYERRIRRIYPALFLVLAVSACAAIGLMLPDELESHARSLLSATFFFANYHSMFDGGYFAAPAEVKPLLHVWSLAVEEQFYLVFPLYLSLMLRYGRRAAGTVTLVVLILSLVYSASLVMSQPDSAFYSTPARAWELLLGSLLALYRGQSTVRPLFANVASFTGLGLILYSSIFFSDITALPGPSALIPTLGASLVISMGALQKNVASQILTLPGFRFFGLISYSLYLWHWPLIVYYGYWRIESVSAAETAILLVVAVLLSSLTWKYVETPFRKRIIVPGRRGVMVAGAGVMLLSGLVAVAIITWHGFPDRVSEAVRQIQATKLDHAPRKNCTVIVAGAHHALDVCNISNTTLETASFAVWGDSHGDAFLPAIHESASHYRLSGVIVGRGGCPPLLDVNQMRQGFTDCDATADAFMSYLQEHPEIKHVILVSRWAIYAMGERFKNEPGSTVYIRDRYTRSPSLDENRRVFKRALERTLSRLESMERRVIIVTQVPETESDVPSAVARAMFLMREIELRPSVVDYQSRQAYVNEVLSGLGQKFDITLVKPEHVMCEKDYCSVMDGGVPMYRDSSHITVSYALKLAKIFDPVFSTISP